MFLIGIADFHIVVNINSNLEVDMARTVSHAWVYVSASCVGVLSAALAGAECGHGELLPGSPRGCQGLGPAAQDVRDGQECMFTRPERPFVLSWTPPSAYVITTLCLREHHPLVRQRSIAVE